jgi:hypothetical protein
MLYPVDQFTFTSFALFEGQPENCCKCTHKSTGFSVCSMEKAKSYEENQEMALKAIIEVLNLS